jgi:alanyl-tRNA synthetase
MDKIQELTGESDVERQANFTPYRVISDHVRAATFLIADGVIPGNTGRNYVCRMIIRRAARFGGKINLHEPFLARVAEVVIDHYGDFFGELVRNKGTILDHLTREEVRFRRTLEGGVTRLDTLLEKLRTDHKDTLPGDQAFDLYATYGLPFEITRDIAREQGLSVDEAGFRQAMNKHRITSGAGEAFGPSGGEEVDIYRTILAQLQAHGDISENGVDYDPYDTLEVAGPVLALVREGVPVSSVNPGDRVEVLLPETCFYVESGGQLSDSGTIFAFSYPGSGPKGKESEPAWEIRVDDMRKPAAGVITHLGEVVRGQPRVGDGSIARVDAQRRADIMRNHTATHLLHAELQAVLGNHARQAGSLVAPDRLRFDFTHPEAVTPEQLERIEAGVNQNILINFPLNITHKPLQKAIDEGAMALFGEKYAENVRTITIGAQPPRNMLQEVGTLETQPHRPFSYELCGGTHVNETADIGIFIITSEGSAAAGIRRIEAVTGRFAYELIQGRFRSLKETAAILATTPEEVPHKVESLLENQAADRKQISSLRHELAFNEFSRQLERIQTVEGFPVLSARLPEADADTLRQMADRFRERYPNGVAALASVLNGQPLIIAVISETLVKRGLHAGELVKFLARPLGGGGGGKPTLAQAGGRDASKLEETLTKVSGWVGDRLRS